MSCRGSSFSFYISNSSYNANFIASGDRFFVGPPTDDRLFVGTLSYIVLRLFVSFLLRVRFASKFV